MNTEEFFLVVDLEATCDENHRIPHVEMETIEIGAVLVDGATLQPIDEFQTFIRPVRHPILTPFCTRLTSIRQGDVERAPRFPQAIEALREFIDGRPVLFCSWGNYDRNQLDIDARYHRVSLPLDRRHLNLKTAFAERMNTRPAGMASALRRAGFRLEGTHHRGIDDARNIARLLPLSLGRAQGHFSARP